MNCVKVLFISLLFYLGTCTVFVDNIFAYESKDVDLYNKYESLQKKIQTYSLSAEDLNDIKLLFPNSPNLYISAQKITSLSGLDAENEGLISNSYKTIYLDFIKAAPNKEVLYGYLRERTEWNKDFVKYIQYPGMNLAWYWADIAQSAQYAYEGTKDIRFLDLIMEGIENSFENTDNNIGKKDEFRNYNVDGWGFALTDDSRWETEITLPGRIITPILKFYRLVESDPDLKKRYGKKITPYAQRSIKIIDQYLPEMIFTSDGQGYFVNLRTNEQEAVNHQAAYIQACVQVYAITGEAKYKKAVDGFYKYLLSICEVEDNAYSWPYQILKDSSKIQQSTFWKESITMQMLVDMDSNGFSLSDTDKKRFSNTYLNLIHRGFSSVNAYITVKKEFPFTGYNIMNSNKLGAERLIYWVPADRFNPQITRVVDDYVSTRTDLFPRGWFGYPWDVTAYAYKFTKN